MMKDVRKAFGTSWRSQFLQGVIFEDFHQKYGFPVPRLRAAPLFAFLLAAQFVFEFTVLQLKDHGRGGASHPLGHDVCSCNEQSRFWHGRGIIKFLRCVPLSSIVQDICHRLEHVS